jgi:hypothetical protein
VFYYYLVLLLTVSAVVNQSNERFTNYNCCQLSNCRTVAEQRGCNSTRLLIADTVCARSTVRLKLHSSVM